MEQGEISNWSETNKIDRARHANGFQSSAPYQKSKKLQDQTQSQGQTQAKVTKTMPCVYYNDGSCSYQKHQRPEVFITSTYVVLALLMRADPVVTVLLNVGRRIQNMN